MYYIKTLLLACAILILASCSNIVREDTLKDTKQERGEVIRTYIVKTDRSIADGETMLISVQAFEKQQILTYEDTVRSEIFTPYTGVREFYGRQLGKSDTFFLHSPLYGYDGPRADPDVYVFTAGLSGCSGVYPLMERWRFGGEVTLPFVSGGIYFNAAEVVDFFVGFFTFDPADDDALPFAEEMKDPWLEEEEEEIKGE